MTSQKPKGEGGTVIGIGIGTVIGMEIVIGIVIGIGIGIGIEKSTGTEREEVEGATEHTGRTVSG